MKCDHTTSDNDEARVIALKEEQDELKRELNYRKVTRAQQLRRHQDERAHFARQLRAVEEELARAEDAARGMQRGIWPLNYRLSFWS